MKRLPLLLLALLSLCAQAQSPNPTSPSAVILVDPSTGQSYSAGGTPVATSYYPMANFNSPISVELIDPTTGNPYKATGGGGGSLPSCTLGQLIYYAATGTTGSCLSVGNGLSINSSTIAPSLPNRSVSGTTDTISCSTDANGFIDYTGSSATAVTVPQATGSCGNGFAFSVENTGTGTVTLTPTTSTINGSSSLAVPGGNFCSVISNGTNYLVGACSPLLPSSGGSTFLDVLSNVTTTGTTFVNVVSFSAAANTTYRLTCYFSIAVSAGAMYLQFTGPASPTQLLYGVVSANSSAKTSYSSVMNYASSTTQESQGAVFLDLVNGSTSGTVTLQMENNTASDTATIYAPAFCRLN
jgi:hypothetical protein